MSFGWSAGDLVLAIKVVGTVIQAVDKANGAAAQYQNTVLFFKSLQVTLVHLRSATTAGFDPNLENALNSQLEAVWRPLVDFLVDVGRYEKSLAEKSTQGLLRSFPRKMRWTFQMEEKVSRLERKIAGPLACINILLGHQTVLALSLLQTDLRSSICETISDQLDGGLTDKIRDAIQSISVQPRETSLVDEIVIRRELPVGDIEHHERLSAALERQDMNLREIQSSLNRLNFRNGDVSNRKTVSRVTLGDSYFNSWLYTLATTLSAVWFGLLAVSGPELLFLFHAIRISLESVSSMSTGDKFMFIDVFGQRAQLPWVWFSSYNVFQAFTKAVLKERVEGEVAMMDVYALNQRSQASTFMVRHELWSYIMRPRLELSAGLIVVTICENEPDCPRCFALRTANQKCPNCGMLFYRPFVHAKPLSESRLTEPYKVKISATPRADITEWSNRGIGYWQPLTSVHWLESVKRVVSIYTRRPSTKLVLFTFDCVYEQLWQTWSQNAKLQSVILESTSSQIHITTQLSLFRTSYLPLTKHYINTTTTKTCHHPQYSKEMAKTALQTTLLHSTRILKALLRDLRSWIALSRFSAGVSTATLPELFSSLFHARFLELVQVLAEVGRVMDEWRMATSTEEGEELNELYDETSTHAPSPSPPLTMDPSSSNPSTPSPSPRTSAPPSPSANPPPSKISPPSPTALARSHFYSTYIHTTPRTPRFWWCAYACDACAFELTSDPGRWHCNKCNFGDFDLCVRCVEERGGCCVGEQSKEEGKAVGKKHVLEWVAHPFIKKEFRDFEIEREVLQGEEMVE